ncbi:MAG: YIP1 family protein [Peptococcaceae bacterium]|jgi:hypothetical protein|nr:YIP1 family protein [Peptococcaceae bacterium]
MQHNKSGNEEFPVDVTPCAAGIEQAGLEAPGGQGCAGDSCEPAPPDAIAGVAPGFLELVYGMLFEPGKTLHSVAQRPSLTIALALVTALTLAGVLIWLLTVSQAIDQLAGSAAEGFFPAAVKPVLALGAVLMFIWGYIKWLGYSALVSLTAELLGGVGRSRDVAAIAGLALIPTILLIPAQLLNLYLDAALLMLISVPVVWVWVAVLLVMGVKESHRLSTGRALVAVISPVILLLVLLGLMITGLAVAAVSMFSGYLPDF